MIRNIRDYGSTPPFLSHPLSNNLRLLISQQVHTPTLFRRPIIPLGRVQCGFCLFLSYLILLLFSIVVLRFTLIHESYHHQCTYFHPPFSFPLSVPSRCPCVSASSHARGSPMPPTLQITLSPSLSFGTFQDPGSLNGQHPCGFFPVSLRFPAPITL